MKNIPTTIEDRFNHTEANTDVNLVELFHKHFSHVCKEDPTIGVYNSTRKCARFLLYNCTFDLPSGEKKAKDVYEVSNILSSTGGKDCWDAVNPIVIDPYTNHIVDGVVRLHGLALGKAIGTYFPMRLIGVDVQDFSE